MARMPGALWRPIPASTSRITSYDILCWHTMVGSLWGTDGYFRKIAPGVNSHFGTGPDGTIVQWVDTAFRSGANLNGNHHIISVETADLGAGFPAWNTNDGSQVPAWTDAQLEANAAIAAWVHEEHGIPLTLIPDAKPGRRGQGYHRQGVPGYMVAGAERWSNATGKVCPGNRRIAQIPELIARAKQIAGGSPAPAPEPEDDDMARFITDGGPWWLYDGYRRRYVRPGEPQILEDLGLVKDAADIKKVSSAYLATIPQDPVDPIDETKLAEELAKGLQPPAA